MDFRRLSLCMIVKNEEDCIGKCLSSVRDVVDEIIIVDTGSSDRTIEICESFGAQVLNFTWNGSFSDARNYGIERATGDWILWLDADEEVEATDVFKLRDILYSDDYLISIQLVNYYGEHPDPTKTFNIAHTRLFRNHIGFQFQNRIHETLNVNDIFADWEEIPSIATVPIKIYHYGYLDSYNDSKKKFERNFNMLEEELKQDDHSPWMEYHIASEYYRIKQFDKAFDYINQSIMGFLKKLQTPPSLLYRLKYAILINSGSIDGALLGIDRAITLYPDYVDLHFYKGLILYLKNMFNEAIEVFDHCLDMGEDNIQHLTLQGVGSFQALYYKGCCLEKLGKFEDAAKCYAQAARLSNTFHAPVEALRRLIIKNENLFGKLPENCDNKTLVTNLFNN